MEKVVLPTSPFRPKGPLITECSPRLLYYFRRTTLLVTGTGAPTEFANIEKLPFGAGSLFAPTPFSMLGPYSGGD